MCSCRCLLRPPSLRHLLILHQEVSGCAEVTGSDGSDGGIADDGGELNAVDGPGNESLWRSGLVEWHGFAASGHDGDGEAFGLTGRSGREPVLVCVTGRAGEGHGDSGSLSEVAVCESDIKIRSGGLAEVVEVLVADAAEVDGDVFITGEEVTGRTFAQEAVE